MLIDRRKLLGLSTMGAGLIAAVPSRAAQAVPAPSATGPTPAQNIGPFYPVVRAGENMADLTRVPNQTGRARGELVEVRGAVRTLAGAPVLRRSNRSEGTNDEAIPSDHRACDRRACRLPNQWRCGRILAMGVSSGALGKSAFGSTGSWNLPFRSSG